MANNNPTEPSTVPSAAIASAISPIRFREAYDEMLDEIEAVEEQTLPVFTDLAASTVRIHAHLPAIMSLREQLVALPGFNVALLDKLERYTLAAAQSHVNVNILSTPSRSIQDLEAALLKHRANFIAVARVLEINALLDASTVKGLGSASNYQTLAFDVMTLVGLFRRSWSTITGKCPLTEEMLVDAEDLASRMFVAIGVKGREPETVSAAALTRRRAFTLFARAYDEVRRGVTYLRWHEDDIDSFAPSLAGPRKGRSTEAKKSAPAAEADVASASPSASNANNAGNPAPPAGVNSIGLPTDDPIGRG